MDGKLASRPAAPGSILGLDIFQRKILDVAEINRPGALLSQWTVQKSLIS